MSQIEVPSWVVRAAMNAEFCGKSMRDALAFGTDHDEEILHAALTAALGAWVVPQHQCMCTDEDDLPNGPRDIWMDVSAEDFKNLTERNDVRGRTLYTLLQEKPE